MGIFVDVIKDILWYFAIGDCVIYAEALET